MTGAIEITVLIVDEQAETSGLLARALDGAGFQVVGHTIHLDDAVELIRTLAPQVVLADIRRSRGPRARRLRRLVETSPGSCVVVYTTYFTDGEEHAFLRAGAVCCLLKGMRIQELAAEMRKAIDRA